MGRITKTYFLMLIIFSTTCKGQENLISKEEKVYSLIKEHYEIDQMEDPNRFFYFKTLSIKDSPNLDWLQEISLSEFLNDSLFKKKCNKISELLDSGQTKVLNSQFSNLSTIVLNKKKLPKDVLGMEFLDKETYNNVPDAANRRISYPIILNGINGTYGIFVEDAHNEGGNLYIYELKENRWQLLCKDFLWLVYTAPKNPLKNNAFGGF